ncbi:UTP--glucose-1-phosphate uridylyltransferase [Cellulomonas chitinilytica]|uniref:UTP--glucose-1-phosphate uridylyltransferase n=1 Tax=Cellulomonas chitinilytica TaxID=398759 RepID=A0A919P1M8_9CELL|nr:sugar phosphate nucleotidyltransferase [Cellulomonas chitinilytica]GIG20595.1 UTP--glucose-1-phosphate uridylyltransferase [Cellulomonas chitinilytica]
MPEQRVRTAVVPVAGRGSRMGPLTSVVPKELFPLGRLPVLHHVVAELVEAGIERVVLVTSPGKAALNTYVERVLVPAECAPAGVEVRLVRQGPVPGNGGAILTGAEHADGEPFLVVWGDEVFVGPSRAAALLECHDVTGLPCLALVEVGDDDVPRCGIAHVQGPHGPYVRVGGIVEKPAAHEVESRLASVGGVVVDAGLLAELRRTPPGPDGEVYLSAALATHAAGHPVLGCLLASTWHETGSPEGYARAFVAVARTEGLLGLPDDLSTVLTERSAPHP